MRVPVLTYHSINIAGNDYDTNDHVALAQDLETIRRLGMRIVPLHRVVDALLGAAPESESEMTNAVALSFDDGSWFDWYDIDHPTCGLQRGFAGILRDFETKTSAPIHATSFVIASPDARETLDRTCMIGRGWWTDAWWPEATREGLLAIESHSWDHNHHTLPQTVQRDQVKGTFRSIDTHADADAEIRQAANWLDARLAPRRSHLFAYPYGESNEYLVNEYLPKYEREHRLHAAFDTAGAPIERSSNRWLLPRYVCGQHWKNPEELQTLLRDLL